MVYKRFRIICTIRILLLSATVFFTVFLLFRTSFVAVTVAAGLLVVYQVFSLIRFVEVTNRDLNRFLEAIRYEDFSQTFGVKGLGSSFDDLKAAFNDVVERFRRTRAEKEENYRYLQTIVEHVGVGLLSYRSDGEVSLVNRAARRMLGAPRLTNIRTIEPFSRELVDVLQRIVPGETTLVRVEEGNDVSQLMVHATEFITHEEQYTLVSLQNIQSELEEKEMEAWQNLIRVLTHEIMNSITPIASLASTVSGMLPVASAREGSPDVDLETVRDVRDALQTIEKRSRGLLHFVESYRELTRIPRPDFQIVMVSSLFERVGQLMESQIREAGIEFRTVIDPETLEITADPELMEQVLINLLLNSIQALDGRSAPMIRLTAGMNDRGRVLIQVVDNGPGILPDAQDKIFIPFFTTRPNGSGIGLSLSRRIMRIHRGTIGVHSEPDVETVFTLTF
jgi:nitrogen fixation/metabolism regulation signal transduction histidine kinase